MRQSLSRSARTARIEIVPALAVEDGAESRSARTARIEIRNSGPLSVVIDVAVRKDRED